MKTPKTLRRTSAKRNMVPSISKRMPRAPRPGTVASSTHAVRGSEPWTDALRYSVDFWQRSILFLDILRERANNTLAHEQAGLPPLLDFDFETLLDARSFEHPANYALLRVTRSRADVERGVDDTKHPIIVLDPRAGHGPGIGGFKQDSEVGIALREGHPVYFVSFFPEPCPGQTLGDVHHALRRFVAEVAKRHGGRAPALYGNCQAGWAVTLLSADCAGLVGPAVLNGSPLSYWAGASDVNPMRLGAGFVGGAWLTHFLSDLGNGRLDGAWLVQNFENLKPENALWEKYYNLFSNVDQERQRFLDFERWWGGYYFLGREEIMAIVENLFVGNKLEQGEMRICECCVADLKRIRNPLLIFASSGDNITPPHQALGWIPAIYPTTRALKSAGQRIVYLLNSHVGHLGIFVSASVARLEHRAILQNLYRLEQLRPGLYEMKISESPADDRNGDASNISITFEERDVQDIRYEYPREEFERVARLSKRNELLYSTFISPWIRASANPISALWLKWLQPMRTSRYAWSEKINPGMFVIASLADSIRSHRQAVGAANPLTVLERASADRARDMLKSWARARDAELERAFEWLYG